MVVFDQCTHDLWVLFNSFHLFLDSFTYDKSQWNKIMHLLLLLLSSNPCLYEDYFAIYFYICIYYLWRKMTNLAKFEFVALDISGKNYLSWVLDAEIHLQANLGNATKDGMNASQHDRTKAMIFSLLLYPWRI